MKEIIAMHGWGGDSKRWQEWIQPFAKDNWIWKSAERGYGDIKSTMPTWIKPEKNTSNKRVLICHSLGLHLIDQTLLKQSNSIILLSSFGRFIPTDSNRALKIALKGMQQALGTDKENAMLASFYEKSAKPELSNTILNNNRSRILSFTGREKLKADLELLINTKSIPRNFPNNSNVLIINGLKDQIITPSTRKLLINDLKGHLETPPIIWNIDNLGHSLKSTQLIISVKDWLEE